MENALWSVLRVAALTQSITQAGWCYLLLSSLFQTLKMQPTFQNVLQAQMLGREAVQSVHFSYGNYILNMPTQCTYATQCMYYYQHCPTCFGAYCAIFRKNSAYVATVTLFD
jgi:hypothetical protein